MSEDRDYRPEALSVSDEIRWLGAWCRIMGKQFTGGSDIVLRLLDGDRWFTVFYRPGCWVAAHPQSAAA